MHPHRSERAPRHPALDTHENPGYTPIAQWRTYRIANFRRTGILPVSIFHPALKSEISNLQ